MRRQPPLSLVAAQRLRPMIPGGKSAGGWVGTAWWNPLLGPAFHVRVDCPDLFRGHDALERGHAPLRTALADHLEEFVGGGHRSTGCHGNEQVRRHRIGEYILAMTPGAVHAVLPPALVFDLTESGLLSPGALVARRLSTRGRSVL